MRNKPSVKDLRTSSTKRYGTDIAGPCTAGVFAAHPGIASVHTAPNLGTYVRVRANGAKGLTTTYGYLSRANVVRRPADPVGPGPRSGRQARPARLTAGCGSP